MHRNNQKLESHIWWVLQRIDAEFYLLREGETVLRVPNDHPFDITEGDTSAPPYSVQTKILDKLAHEGVINIDTDFVTSVQASSDRVFPPGVTPTPPRATSYSYFISLLQPKFDEMYEKYENTFVRKPPISIPSTSIGQKKVLRVLEGLYEQWDLAPKQRRKAAIYRHGALPPHVDISPRVWHSWTNEVDMDYTELTNVLERLQEEGLIEHFSFINEYA